MKTIISILSIILCVFVLFVGQLHWNQKTSTSASSNEASDVVHAKPSSQNNGINPTDIDSLLAHTKNWPAESVDTLKANLEAGQPFKIAFLGSSALGEGRRIMA